MKKILTYIFVAIISVFIFMIGFEDKKNIAPNHFYQVYLDDQILGVIKNKDELLDYIDKEGTNIKEKYNVDKVEAPNGIDIKKIVTYDEHLDDVKDVYNKLKKLKPFTITGYQFNIKTESENEDGEVEIKNNYIYVTDEEIFQESVEDTIIAFVGEDKYNAYLDGTQEEIKEVGQIFTNIYVDNVITSKKTSIPIDEEIFNEVEDLSQYILFSTTEKGEEYTVKKGDTIESISTNNKISVQEFLISNPEFTSADNILYEGQKVLVSYAKPMVDVIANVKLIEDQTQFYGVEERRTDTLVEGDEQVIQNGENGVNRVTQELVYKNGFVDSQEVLEQVTIKPSTNKVILIGTKYISGVGGRYWTWPTNSTNISSHYGYRCFSGSCSFHQAIDITSNYWAPIYAANNGVVTMATYSYGTYGIFVAINHNNGYGSAYAHLAAMAPGVKVGLPVARGQIIGYMGNTGRSSGVHLHFEIYYGGKHPGYNFGSYVSPLSFY